MRNGSKLREKLTYANVMATLAVFLVLGGGAYAATKLPKNGVGTKQIKKNSVTGEKSRTALSPAVTSTFQPSGWYPTPPQLQQRAMQILPVTPTPCRGAGRAPLSMAIESCSRLGANSKSAIPTKTSFPSPELEASR